MKTFFILFQLACCMGLFCIPTACLSGRNVVSVTDPSTIRYGENGVPTYIKGNNLSACLDKDLEFQNLQAENRYADIAFYYLDRQRSLFKLTSARDEFRVYNINSDNLGMTHIHLEQVYNKIPVWGKDIRIHLNADNQVYYVHGSYQPISPDVQTKAVISTETAGSIALKKRDNPAQWRIEKITNYIWAPGNDLQRLAFRVHLLQNGFYRESCFVDAVSGRILHSVSDTSDIHRK